METQTMIQAKLAAALVKTQLEMGDATKGAKNPFFKSNYADLNSIREAVLPAANANGLVVLQPTVTVDGVDYVRTRVIHESGEETHADTKIVVAKANDPQAYGSAISYARRYGLQAFFNIGAVDDDGEGAMGRSKPAPAPAKAAPTLTAKPTTAASSILTSGAGMLNSGSTTVTATNVEVASPAPVAAAAPASSSSFRRKAPAPAAAPTEAPAGNDDGWS